MHPEFTPADAVRFWAKVAVADPGACWLWTATKHSSGYGYFSVASRRFASGSQGLLAHRIAWELTNGPIPDATPFVLHRCDTPPCCNPAHLFLGTQSDNNRDMREKGREARGERHGAHTRPERRPTGVRHGSAKLTDAAVRAIRMSHRGGVSIRRLAVAYGVNFTTARDVVHRTTWQHVE